MTDQARPDPEEESFGASLQSGIRELRERRGPCPPPDELLGFLERRLNPADLTRINEHIEACGLCDIALTRLRGTEAEAVSRVSTTQKGVQAFFWNPMVAYGLAALLAYPAYLGISRRRTAYPASPNSSASVPAAEAVPVFDLTQTRGAATGIHLAAGDERFGLRLFAPLKPGYTYAASVKAASGTTVQEVPKLGRPDALGIVLVVCTRSAFSPGEYRLVVRETSSGHQEFEYVFEVE